MSGGGHPVPSARAPADQGCARKGACADPRTQKRGIPPPPRFEGGLRAAIAPVCLEHQKLSESLRRFRTGRALLACIDDRVCRRLENHLRELERDLHEAMNLENFVLYPRAIELEDQLSEARVPAHA